MERVVCEGGFIHVEVPFTFPVHGAPWDFFRFTPWGLRSLFRKSRLVSFEVAEGNGSGAAVINDALLVNLFRGRKARMAAVAFGRLSLWWMKSLDRMVPAGPAKVASAKGLAATFQVDGLERTDEELVADVGI